MELVEGNELKGPVPLDTTIGYAKQLAAALEAAHEKGIVHRDLKPANIKITPEGVLKVLDFGLAKTAGPSEDGATLTIGATQVGTILGTAAYMAPEEARGKAVDKRADIWAFGGPSGPPAGGSCAGAATDSFNFSPFLATTRAYMGISLVSWCNFRPNRSFSRFCHITLACSLVAPAGTLATISKCCESIQSGPEIWYSCTPYALAIRSIRDMLLAVIWPGSPADPGPPCIPIRPGVGGADGLTEATSNAGPSTPCAKAVAQHARTASPQPEIL
jgi:serine/threonine protein kinase